MTVGNFTEFIGTTFGLDSLTGANLEIIYGVGGNESLVAGSTNNSGQGFNVLVGGTGRTLYSVRDDATAIILENADNEENILFTNILSTGINPNSSNFVAVDIDDRHLYFGNRESSQYVLLLDWKDDANRIEEFYFTSGTWNYETFASRYQDLIGYEGSLSFHQFVEQFDFPVEQLGIENIDLETIINQIETRAENLEQTPRGVVTRGDSPPVPNTSSAPINFNSPTPIGQFDNFVELVGTDIRDSISGNDLEIVYGLQGDDILNSYPNFSGGNLSDGGETTILVGGSGENDYQLRPNSTAIVLENGAGEGNILWTTIQSPGVGLEKATSFFIEIDNRHLYLGDRASNQRAILIDWQETANQIESFDLVDGRISYDDFVDRFRNSDGYEGNVSWDDLEQVDFERLGFDTARIETTLSQIRQRSAELELDNSRTVEFYRFRNTNYQTGAYIFVAEAERDSILNDENLSSSFELEGRNPDGTVNPAFTASLEPGEGMLPFFRLQSRVNPGTYLYVGVEEYRTIIAEDSDQRGLWSREGFESPGVDIPEFYLPGVGSTDGVAFNRLQNLDNGTFIFTAPDETAAITNDPNLNNLFINQGVAFHAL